MDLIQLKRLKTRIFNLILFLPGTLLEVINDNEVCNLLLYANNYHLCKMEFARVNLQNFYDNILPVGQYGVQV